MSPTPHTRRHRFEKFHENSPAVGIPINSLPVALPLAFERTFPRNQCLQRIHFANELTRLRKLLHYLGPLLAGLFCRGHFRIPEESMNTP
ncbi:hypothetical protein D9M70_590430 [compost metagenome]